MVSRDFQDVSINEKLSKKAHFSCIEIREISIIADRIAKEQAGWKIDSILVQNVGFVMEDGTEQDGYSVEILFIEE